MSSRPPNGRRGMRGRRCWGARTTWASPSVVESKSRPVGGGGRWGDSSFEFRASHARLGIWLFRASTQPTGVRCWVITRGMNGLLINYQSTWCTGGLCGGLAAGDPTGACVRAKLRASNRVTRGPHSEIVGPQRKKMIGRISWTKKKIRVRYVPRSTAGSMQEDILFWETASQGPWQALSTIPSRRSFLYTASSLCFRFLCDFMSTILCVCVCVELDQLWSFFWTTSGSLSTHQAKSFAVCAEPSYDCLPSSPGPKIEQPHGTRTLSCHAKSCCPIPVWNSFLWY